MIFPLHSHKVSSTSRCLSPPNSMISGNHFSCFSWLVFSRVRQTFWRFPSFQNDYTIQKKPSNHPTNTLWRCRIRTCENWSMLAYCPRQFEAQGWWIALLMSYYLAQFILCFCVCWLPFAKETFEKPQVHGFCCALSQTPDGLYRDFSQRDRSSNHISSGQISPRPHTA